LPIVWIVLTVTRLYFQPEDRGHENLCPLGASPACQFDRMDVS
jgi:hypothetical protein